MVAAFGASSRGQTSSFPTLRPGATAPVFSRLDLSGNRIDLQALRGKVVLLDFWASWCAPCLLEIPHLVALQKQLGPQGLQVIGVSMDDSAAPVIKLTRRVAFNYPVLLGDAKLGAHYGGIYGLPVRILIARDGTILRIWKGDLSPSVLERTLKSALAGSRPH
jgi:thiol-disulfide isomerase/thioredoxin